MKRLLGTLLLLFTAALSQAQNPGKPSTDDADAVPTSSVPSVSTQGGAPVVIRSEPAGTSAGAGTTPVGTSARSASAISTTGNPVAPAPASNDFQQFVAAALGHELPIFASTLFSNSGAAFAPAGGVTPPADYVLGTGDQILIRSWGKIDMDVRATVDRNGQIFIPRVGTLTVAGLQLDRLSDFIRTAISQQFTGFELSVSLGTLRSIQIFVLGNALKPGVYTISSITTFVNALFSSGGPSSTGSLRDIQLKRDGKVVSHFDVYRLLLGGDKTGDTRVQPGDILFIPPLGPQVAVDGDVGTPAIYELKSGETVGSLLTEAGGLTPVAATSRAVLEHVIGHSRRSVEEFALDDKGLAIPMQGADILRVFPISPKISDAVTLRGNVAQPGRYSWHAGMRVSDLIPNREFLLTRAYYNQQNSLDVNGGTHPFSAAPGTDIPGAATHDTEINWNYAAIERLDTSDLTRRVIPFALGEAIGNPSSPENKPLEAGDILVVYSSHDVALPLTLQAKFVRVDGQVKAPGVYRMGPEETLRDLVTRAGGLDPHAYLYASSLNRESTRAEQEARLKTLIARESEDILAPSNQRAGATGPGDVSIRQAYIAQLSKVQPDGRIVLRLPVNASAITDLPALPLEDGDHFFVPMVPNTVEVLGAVYNGSTLAFTSGSRAQVYLDQAGGPTRAADTKREFILRANGMLVSRQNAPNFKRLLLNPGDALVVPPKFKASAAISFDFTNWAQLISTFALTAVTIKALQ